MAKTDERKAYDALLKEHYPPGRARKTVSDKVKEKIAAALAKAKASEAKTKASKETKSRLNPRSLAAARNAKAETKDKPLDLSIPKRLPKEKEAAFQEDVKNIRKLKRPLKEVTVGTAQFQKKATEPSKPLSAANKERIRLHEKAQQMADKMDADAKAPVIAVTQQPAGTVINTGDSDAPSAQLTAVRKHLKAEEPDKPFGEKAGRKAIQSFFKDTFGYTPTVTYDAPGQGDDQMEFYGKKKGGKVTAKRPTAKKYAMNRGGKVASVRKPTRA